LAPVHHTKSPDNLPESGKTMADTANREGIAERWAAPAVHKSIEIAVALRTSDEQRLHDVALSMGTAAHHHDTHPLSLRQTVPGIGQLFSLGRRDDMPDMARFPTGQDGVA
jgi:hypothetical protein